MGASTIATRLMGMLYNEYSRETSADCRNRPIEVEALEVRWLLCANAVRIDGGVERATFYAAPSSCADSIASLSLSYQPSSSSSHTSTRSTAEILPWFTMESVVLETSMGNIQLELYWNHAPRVGRVL